MRPDQRIFTLLLLGFGTLAQGARDFQSLRTIMSDRARYILNPCVGFSEPDPEMDEARADFRHALLSTRCEIERGMKGTQSCTANFTGPLANLNEEWGMRVLTEGNMATYWGKKELQPAPLLGRDRLDPPTPCFGDATHLSRFPPPPSTSTHPPQF